MHKQFSTPILFLTFNRPENTKRVFSEIKRIKPKDLYIACDGPRSQFPDDFKKTAEVRKIVQNIDWDCNVKTLFRENNLGCTNAVLEAINWFFKNVEEGIILEDDCLPDQSFFLYCQELLYKYRNVNKIFHISGSNFQFGKKGGKYSYYFSRFPSCWGWATWRRAWEYYDFGLIERVNDASFQNTISKNISNNYQRNYWKWLFNFHRNGQGNMWDLRWTYCVWHNNAIAITPTKNLIKNIGYGKDATTSKGNKQNRNRIAALEINTIENINHPEEIRINKSADKLTERVYNPPLSLPLRIKREIGFILPIKFKNLLKKVFSYINK